MSRGLSLPEILGAATRLGAARVTMVVHPDDEAGLVEARARLPLVAGLAVRIQPDRFGTVERGTAVVLRGWPNDPTAPASPIPQ